jgi:hypothetical protein
MNHILEQSIIQVTLLSGQWWTVDIVGTPIYMEYDERPAINLSFLPLPLALF